MANEYTPQQILKFLRSVSIMSAAVNGLNGPISTVLLFHIDDDFTLYFATHSDSFKAKALALDDRISYSVWEHRKMLVQADGIATPITDPKEINEILDKLVSHVGDFWPPVLRLKGEGYVIYKIATKWLRALDLSQLTIVAPQPPFTEIVFT